MHMPNVKVEIPPTDPLVAWAFSNHLHKEEDSMRVEEPW